MSEVAPIGLSSQAYRRIRRVSVATVFLLAVCAAVLSFSGLRLLALQAGFPPELAWMFPIIVDGLVLAGSLGVISAALAGVKTTYFWFLTLLGVFISVVGNVASAPNDFLSQAVHAAPPLIFALSVEGLLKVYRHAVTRKTPNDAGNNSGGGAAVAPSHVPSVLEAGVAEPAAPQAEAQPVEAQSVPVARPSVPRQVEGTEHDPEPVDTSHKGEPAGSPTKEGVDPNERPVSGSDGEGRGRGGTAKERLVALLTDEPEITGAEAARRLDIDPSHARKILRELRTAQ